KAQTRRWCRRSPTGRSSGSRTSNPSPSTPRAASTPPPTTSGSSWNGTVGSWSARPARATASSSARRRAGGWPSSRSKRSADYPSGMPMYQRLGDVPRKRHIQFRDDGTLLNEEVFGLEGFSGNESILYHLQSPVRIRELGDFEPIVRDEWVPDAH